MGSMARLGSRSSPSTSSRFTSSPITKKNTAISPSLIQCLSEWIISNPPSVNPTCVLQKAR